MSLSVRSSKNLRLVSTRDSARDSKEGCDNSQDSRHSHQPRTPSPLPLIQTFSNQRNNDHSSSSRTGSAYSKTSNGTLGGVNGGTLGSVHGGTSGTNNFATHHRGKVTKLMQLAQDDHEIIEALKKKNAELQAQLSGRMESVGSIQRNFENLSKLYMQEKDRANTFEKSAALSSERLETIQEQLRQMEILRNELSTLQMQNTKLKERCDQADLLMNDKVNQNMRLQKKHESLISDMHQYKNLISEYETKLQFGAERQKAFEDDIKALKIRQKETLQELSQAQSEVTNLQIELEEKKAMIEELQDQLHSLEMTDNELKSITQQMNALKRERLIMSQTLHKYETTLKEYEEREKSLQTVLKREKRDKEMLETDLAMLNQKLVQSKDNLKALESQMIEEKKKSAQTIEILEEKLASIQEQHKTLKEQNGNILVMLQTSSKKTVGLESDIDVLRDENDQLKSDLFNRCKEIESLKLQVKETQIEAKKWKTHFDTANIKTASSDDLLAKYKRMEMNHTKQIRQLESGNKALIAKNKELADALHACQKDIQDMMKDETTKISSLQVKIQEYQDDIATYKKELVHLTDELHKAERKNLEITEELSESKIVNEELQQQLNDVNEREIKMEEMVENLRVERSKNTYLEGEIQQLNLKLSQATSEISQHRNLEKEMELLIKERRDLVERIKITEEKCKKDLMTAEEKWKKEREALMAEPILQKLQAREKLIQDTIEKLLKNEKATSSALTCMKCMNLFDDPMVCVPCGHSFCRKCLAYSGGALVSCPECSESIQNTVHSEIIDILSGKCEYRRQTLDSLVKFSTKSLVSRNL